MLSLYFTLHVQSVMELLLVAMWSVVLEDCWKQQIVGLLFMLEHRGPRSLPL